MTKQRLRRGMGPAEFERLVAIEADDCVLWPYAATDRGYGHFKLNGIDRSVHVLACERRNGLAPTRRHEVAHSCGTPACMNYRHLRWATHAENMADRVQHGTHNRGELHPQAVLTADQVVEIRRLHDLGESQAALGRRFGVSFRTVHLVVHRKAWKWLD